jgi:hypothetical protein
MKVRASSLLFFIFILFLGCFYTIYCLIFDTPDLFKVKYNETPVYTENTEDTYDDSFFEKPDYEVYDSANDEFSATTDKNTYKVEVETNDYKNPFYKNNVSDDDYTDNKITLTFEDTSKDSLSFKFESDSDVKAYRYVGNENYLNDSEYNSNYKEKDKTDIN